MRCDRTATRPDKKPGRESHTFVNTKTSLQIIYLRTDRPARLFEAKRNRRTPFTLLLMCTAFVRHSRIVGSVQRGSRRSGDGRVRTYSLASQCPTYRDNYECRGHVREIYFAKRAKSRDAGRAVIAATGFRAGRSPGAASNGARWVHLRIQLKLKWKAILKAPGNRVITIAFPFYRLG